ncbi:MAG: hypothetical protein KDD47_16265, partial [Acidobacteria bacterium]|nr:hypothetical protein [Acidobacteriota bacterium]
MKRTQKQRSLARTAGFLVGAIAALTFFTVAQADDRELLGRRARPPYVFILFDTSGSMNWNVGELDAPFLRSDSADSKMYQAKSALYQVVSGLSGVNFGFASFNQDSLRVQRKHWAYQAVGDGITLLTDPSTGDPLYTYPEDGDIHIFGRIYNCTSNTSTGCSSTRPARLFDEWEAKRMQMLSKLGDDGNSRTSFWVRADVGSNRYTFEVRFDDDGTAVNYGDATITVRVRILGVGFTFDETKDMTFEIVPGGESGFVAYDLGSNRSTPSNPGGRQEFFSFQDAATGGTCNGWEGNGDTGSDDYRGSGQPSNINLKVPTDTSEPQVARRYGDVIPLNWDDNNRTAILDRLSPNRLLLADPADAEDPSFVPDFRVAPFLVDEPLVSGDQKLDLIPALRTAEGTVLIPTGSTPLGNSLSDFRSWYNSWRTLAADGVNGDPNWGCRDVFVLMLTDGIETCSSNGPAEAETLFNAGVKTYVVGFGVESAAGGDSLDEIAEAGGTVAIRPQNIDQLIESLREVFNEIQSQ